MAIPSRVVSVSGEMATVEAFGSQRTVSLMLMSDPVNIGDYLLIQAGGFAFERVDAGVALATLHLFDDMVEE